jgi:hypothetical protein
MKRRFEFEFEDESKTNTISFKYGELANEKLTVSIEHDVSVVYANRAALLLFGRTLIKMAICPYPDAFHVHLHQDLDADKPEVLRVIDDSE